MASIDSLSIQITASTTSAQKKVNDLVVALNKLVTAIDKIDASKFETLSNATSSLSEGLKGLKGASAKSLTKVAQALNDVSAQKGAFDPIVQSEQKVAEESKAAATGIEKINTEAQNVNATALDQVAQAAEHVTENLTETTSRMSGFKSLLAKLKIIVPTDGLVDVNKKIDSLSAKVAELREKMEFKKRDSEYVDSAAMEKDKAQIEGLINELERLKLKKQELESHGGFRFNMSGVLKGLGNTVSSVSKKFDGLISKLRKLKSHTRDTAKATKSFDISATSLAKSLTKVTRMLRLMVIRMALRTVIKETGNGFKSLAIHSQEFDSAMSGLINSSKTLAYSFSAMVSPLLNALAPALIYVINLLTKFMNIINQIFSALTGKGTWNKAKNFTGSWADDLKSANKSAQELKKTVLAFDELNQLDDNKSSGGSGGSGDIADMYETLPIEDKWRALADYIKNLAKRLFEPIKKAWENVGDFVKKSWKYALDEVYKLGKDVARDFWKVWEQDKTQKIFENILVVVGYIGQAVGNLARQFRIAWNASDNGLRILETIRDIVLIITDHIKGMAKATADWADTLNFTPLLNSFRAWLESLKEPADALMGVLEDIYTKVILPLGKWAVEVGAPKLLQVFIDFNQKVDWEALRQKLQDLWEALEPFAEAVGEGLIKFIGKVSEKLADFVNSENFDKFIDALIKWMENVDADDVADGLEKVAKGLLWFKGVSLALSGLIAAIPVLSGLINILKWFSGSEAVSAATNMTTVAQAASETAGGFSKFTSGIVGTGAVIQTVDLHKHTKKISDDFTFLEQTMSRVKAGEITKEQAEEILEASITAEKAATKEEAASYTWSQALKDFFSMKGVNLEGFKNLIKQAMGGVEDLSGDFEELGNTSKTTSKVMTESSEEIGGSSKQFEKLSHTVDTTERKLSDNFSKIQKTSTDTADSLAEFSKDSSNSMSDFSQSISDGTYNVRVEFKEMATAFSDASNDMDIEMNTLVQTADTTTTDVASSFNNLKDSFTKDKWTFSGVADGLRDTFENAKNAIKGVWNEIADKLNGEHQIGTGKIRINLPHFYATGGFPEDGWFRANQGEIMGRFDNGRSVVANNMQITDGIAKAVYSAMMSAGSGNGATKYINNTIQIDGKTIARAVTVGQDKMKRLYSPTQA